MNIWLGTLCLAVLYSLFIIFSLIIHIILYYNFTETIFLPRREIGRAHV